MLTILLLSWSSPGLQQMVNVCTRYGLLWDISFNSAKAPCITFGGCYPTSFPVVLNNVEHKRVYKLKYLGCNFPERSCRIDHCYGISKFYGKILAVNDQKKNEMATLHLVKTYCVPAMLYGGEIWYSGRSD